ncbi:unnamed protein product [Ectocarpus sp. 4 AP-2014]
MWSGGAMPVHAAHCNDGCAYHTTRRLDVNQVTYLSCPQLRVQLWRGCAASPKTYVGTCLAQINNPQYFGTNQLPTIFSEIQYCVGRKTSLVPSLRFGEIFCVKPRGRMSTLERAHSAGDSLQQPAGEDEVGPHMFNMSSAIQSFKGTSDNLDILRTH